LCGGSSLGSLAPQSCISSAINGKTSNTAGRINDANDVEIAT